MKPTIQGCHRGYNLKSSADGFNLAIVRLEGRIARINRLTGKSIPSQESTLVSTAFRLSA